MKEFFVDQSGKMTPVTVIKKPGMGWKHAVFPLMVIMLLGSGGCSSLSYYMHMIDGHMELISKERDISEMIRDETTDSELREKLIASQSMRDFASTELALPDNDSYRSYADIGRPYAVWNVIAAEKFSISAKQWCFVFVGFVFFHGCHLPSNISQYSHRAVSRGTA